MKSLNKCIGILLCTKIQCTNASSNAYTSFSWNMFNIKVRFPLNIWFFHHKKSKRFCNITIEMRYYFSLNWNHFDDKIIQIAAHTETSSMQMSRFIKMPIISDIQHDFTLEPVVTSSNLGDNVIMGCSPPDAHPAPIVRYLSLILYT